MTKPISIILAISAAILGFLFWLIYFQEPPAGIELGKYAWISGLNAIFNALSATSLLLGIYFIKRGEKQKHKQCMLAACFASTCFLVGYMAYHTLHGDTKFLAEGWVRPLYFFILISHILLSIVVVPMVLMTLYAAFNESFTLHRKIARFTFPAWLYVSVTGIIIYAMLQLLNTPPS